MDAEQKTAPETEQTKKKPRGKDKTNAEIERLTGELAQQQEQYQRMLAEYANYKRRTEQEKQQIGAFTKAELLTALLTSVDNMEKAIAAPAGDDYKTGVDLVLRQFMEALEKLGLESVGVEGEPRVAIDRPVQQLTVGTLQAFIDEYLLTHPEAEVDYIHGEDSTTALASAPDAIGFLFGGMEKSQLFRTVIYDGALPRKTFSMGHARDKRYYMECRKIK